MYSLLSDFNYIIKKNFNLCLTYMIFLIYYLLLFCSGESDIQNIFLNHAFALECDFGDILGIMWFIVNILFYIYITVSLVYKDYDLFDNFFSRITFIKWLIYKMLSPIIFAIIFNLILYILTIIALPCQTISFIVLIKKILSVIIINLYTLFVAIYYYKNKLLAYIFIIIGCIPLFFHIVIADISIYLLIMIIFIIILFTIITFRKNRFSDLEMELGDL